MDVLSDALNAVRLKSGLCYQAQLSAPWGLHFEPSSHISFCFVLRGNAYVTLDSQPAPLVITGGDLVMLSGSSSHSVQDKLDSPLKNVAEILPVNSVTKFGSVTFGGGGTNTTLLFGCFEFDFDNTSPLMEALPSLIQFPSKYGVLDTSIDMTLKLIASETMSNSLGTDFTVTRLLEVLFSQVVRSLAKEMAKCKQTKSWLKAASDEEIGKALSYIHAQPGASLTLSDLAKQCGMSRSAFAAKFAALTEYTPAQYVTLWRMHKAGQLLRNGKLKVAKIAQFVGYESEASFSTAFKRIHGCGPRAFCKKTKQNDLELSFLDLEPAEEVFAV